MLKIKSNVTMNPEIDAVLENNVALFLEDWNGECYANGRVYNWTTGETEKNQIKYYPVYKHDNPYAVIGYIEKHFSLDKKRRENTVKREGVGHFEVEYQDGLSGTAFYEKSLDYVIECLYKQEPHRVPESISWVYDD